MMDIETQSMYLKAFLSSAENHQKDIHLIRSSFRDTNVIQKLFDEPKNDPSITFCVKKLNLSILIKDHVKILGYFNHKYLRSLEVNFGYECSC